VPAPPFIPMPLSKRTDAFDHPDWVFEVKHDGFRVFAFLEAGRVRLVFRNRRQLTHYGDLAGALARELSGHPRHVIEGGPLI
jgi:ATP-dependent DNA ligase